jgi:hypothetical protein
MNMSKKELRKELENVLNASIISLLNSKNKAAAKATGKTVSSASKDIAKKFYKSLKSEKKMVKAPVSPAKRKPVKAAARPKTGTKGKK